LLAKSTIARKSAFQIVIGSKKDRLRFAISTMRYRLDMLQQYIIRLLTLTYFSFTFFLQAFRITDETYNHKQTACHIYFSFMALKLEKKKID